MHIKQERKCVACRQSNQQCEMLRLARINNEFVFDPKNKFGGRGAYVCKNSNCIQNTIKKKLFNRAFKMNLDSKIYEELERYEQNN